jgi:hypothetical protein
MDRASKPVTDGSREIMRIEAYLGVGGDERTIRAIHEETNISDASIRSYPKVKARWSVTGEDAPWGWGTTPVSLDVDNPDEGLKALLSRYRAIFPIIKKYRGQKTAISLHIVTRYREDEDPSGLYLSAETISLLSELGGDLDNDAVWLVGESASQSPEPPTE